MGYIYCITNLINNKKYIGKTLNSITDRFKEHCQDATRRCEENRPLYRAMNKYGKENFRVDLVATCEENELSKKEIYYINVYNTFKSGYNATKGGEGKILYDHKYIIELYRTGLSAEKVAKQVGCHVDTVRNVLKSNNVPVNTYIFNKVLKSPKRVKQIDEDGKLIRIWNSIADAARWISKEGISSLKLSHIRTIISRSATHKHKLSLGFYWEYADTESNDNILSEKTI